MKELTFVSQLTFFGYFVVTAQYAYIYLFST